MTDRDRPILAWEQVHLDAFGAELRRLRQSAGLSGLTLANRAGISLGHLSRLERGRRRPRHSTVARLARALSGAPDSLTERHLVRLLGPVHAPESPRLDRIEKRRDRRVKRFERELSRNPAVAVATRDVAPSAAPAGCVRTGCAQPATRGRLCEHHHWH